MKPNVTFYEWSCGKTPIDGNKIDLLAMVSFMQRIH